MLLSHGPFVRCACSLAVLALLTLGASLAVAAQENWPLLVVDDAQTANPDLVEVALGGGDDLDMAGRTVMLPEGYEISVVAAGLGRPRFMAFDAASNLLVAAAEEGAVLRFPYADGRLGERETLISGLQLPSSVAFYNGEDGSYLYVGEINQVTRFAYDPAGPAGDPEVVIPNLPTDGSHWTRTVAFGPDGKLYLSVGSSCNICIEAEPVRAAVSRANPDGSELEVIATGLRNAVGLAFQPGSDELWATVNERDAQGNEIPPDLVTIIAAGANYGWPGCQPPNAAPQVAQADCSGVTPPTIAIQAHSAPLGLVFWEGDGVPAAFVLAPDGSLIVSDDSGGLIYRISAAE